MKRLLCCLLAFTMVQSPFPVHAQSEQAEESTAQALRTGKLQAVVDFTIPVEKANARFRAELVKGEEKLPIAITSQDVQTSGSIDGHEVQISTMADAEDTFLKQIQVSFDGLPEGTYTLQISGDGFRTIQQEVEIKGYSKYLHMDDVSVFTIGDVNTDSMVNEADYQLVLEAIDTKDDKSIQTFDLNKDGLVDVLDLSIVHETLGVKPVQAKESLGNAIMDPERIDLTLAEGTKIVAGTLEDVLLKDAEQPLQIGFMDEGASLDAGASIDIPLVVKNETIKMNKINIQTGDSEHALTQGIAMVTYLDESGIEQQLELPFDLSAVPMLLTRASTPQSIVIDLGKQVAVKEIVIHVTGTRTNKNLVEISKVEFLNDVYDKIPEPEAAYPKNVVAVAGNESIQLSWSPVVNVNGYEVKYSGYDPKAKKIVEKTVKTDTNTVTLEDLTNFVTYTIAVQSTTEDGWSSGYGDSINATPMPTSVPEMVTDVNAKGSYRAIKVTWGKAENGLEYQLYYRIKNTGEYQKIEHITGTNYTLQELEDGKEYQLYVTSSNAIGEGPKSAIVSAVTTSMTKTTTSKYHLINTSLGEDTPTKGIQSVTYPVTINPNDYPYEYDEFDIVDDDESSFWNFSSWDAGGYNSGKPSPIVEFEKAHTFGEFVVVPSYNEQGSYAYVKVRYWDDENKVHLIENASMKQAKDAQGKVYYRIQLQEPITSNKIQINLAQYWAGNKSIRISEIKYYTYDSLAKDINALFADDLQIELQPEVTQATIDALRVRLETEDQGEKHPDYESLSKDLTYAEGILNDADLSKEIKIVDQTISTKNDAGKGYSYGLSDLQPLGIAALANDKITIYLGKTAGAQGNVQVVFTQPFATPDRWKVLQTLQSGKNEITVPEITSKDIERGGSLYLVYNGKTPSYDPMEKPIKVRISGGTEIPYLNLSGLSDEQAMRNEIAAYVDTLDAYVTSLNEMYKDSAYTSTTQALNVTEFMTDQMLFSLPASEVLKGIKQGSDDRSVWIENCYQNALAMEQLMDLTYAQKGFSRDSEDPLNQKSKTRMNIRYMDVQTAFMYAGGGHVGVPFGSGSSLMKGKPYTCPSDTTQKCSGGALYGWGISHEIGHIMDQVGGVYGETSNNIVPLYSSTIDEESFARIGAYKDDYTNIYQKVTSGTAGYSSSVFTQLGMYWQLHLAYDTTWIRPNDTTGVIAKMYQAYRHNTITGLSKDDALIRMASLGAGKDLSDYFAHWGLMASDETKQWLKDQNLPEETKPIYYLNETARRKRIEGTADMEEGTTLSVSLTHKSENGNDDKRATLQMEVNKSQDRILGYEIYRNGKVIAFTNDATFTDTIMTSNNRVYTYEVIAYDYNLRPTNKVTLDPVKISHDGSLDKSNWTYTSNVAADQDVEGADQPSISTLKNAFDNDYQSTYSGSVAKGNVEIIIDMNTTQPVIGFKYTKPFDNIKAVKKYEVQISNDKINWQSVASGTLNTTDTTQTIFFTSDGDQASEKLETFDAQYVKFIAKQKDMALAELDILTPPGDNIDVTDAGVGLLKEDFTYAPEKVIPKGSLVFTGDYRGNPAFNAVLLINENDQVLGGENGNAKSILMATIPENSPLNEIARGTWIYWIEPNEVANMEMPASIKAELYRVDDASDNSGQRMVSDTLPIQIPEVLPEIELRSSLGGE